MAKQLYDHFFAKVQELYGKDKVKDGVFQAMMDVGLVNDGPVGESLRYQSIDGEGCSFIRAERVADHATKVTLEINTGKEASKS